MIERPNNRDTPCIRKGKRSSTTPIDTLLRLGERKGWSTITLDSDTPFQVLNNYLSHYDKSWFKIFSDATPEMKKAVQRELSLRILTSGLHADPASSSSNTLKAFEILESNPDSVFDYTHDFIPDIAGRLCQGSPLQVAFGAGDIWLVEALRDNVFPLFSQGIKKAQALFDKQIKEQFPNYHNPITLDAILLEAPDLVFSEEEQVFFELESRYYDKRNIQQIIAVKKALMAVVDAITIDDCHNAYPNTKTQTEIDNLKKALAPDSDVIITSGLHFPLFILMMIADVYREKCFNNEGAFQMPVPPLTAYMAEKYNKKLENWENRWGVYSFLVLGMAQEYLTAVDSQSIKDKKYRIINDRAESSPQCHFFMSINPMEGEPNRQNNSFTVPSPSKPAFIIPFAKAIVSHCREASNSVTRFSFTKEWNIEKKFLGQLPSEYPFMRATLAYPWMAHDLYSYALQKYNFYSVLMQPTKENVGITIKP